MFLKINISIEVFQGPKCNSGWLEFRDFEGASSRR